MGNLVNTLKVGRIYEQWACSVPDSFERDKIHYRQVDTMPRKPEAKARMVLHGEEYHRVGLVRIFRNESDISTLFEVVPTLKEANEEIDTQTEVSLAQARDILRDHRGK